MKKKDDRQNAPVEKGNGQKNEPIHYFPIFMSIGISVGLAIGAAVGNIPIGMCIGLGIGTCLGTALDRLNRKDKENAPDESQSS